MNQALEALKDMGSKLMPKQEVMSSSLRAVIYSGYKMYHNHDVKEYAIRMLQEGVSPEDIRQFMQAAITWRSNGFPVFRLTPSLSAALALTEPSGLMKEVQLPFSAFLLQTPELDFSVETGGMKVAIRNVLVTTITTMAQDSPHVARVTSAFDLACNGDIGKANTLVDQLEADQAAGTIPTRSQWIMLAISDGHLGVELKKTYDPEQSCSEWFLGGDLAAEAVRRLLINFCFYLQTKKELPPPVQKKKGRRAGYKIYKVGNEVHLPSHAIEAAYARARAGEHPDEWKMRKRFVVRGHWRNQACGLKMKERRKLWIKPYWKGPETAQEMERLYKAETFTEAGMNDA